MTLTAIVIEVEGGIVRGVYTAGDLSDSLQVVVVDFDPGSNLEPVHVHPELTRPIEKADPRTRAETQKAL